MTYEPLNQKSQFVLILNAHVSHGVFPSTSNVCVKVDVVHGPDWTVLAGQRQAVSATSVRSDQGHKFVFDLPYHITFSSTNPFRWPQLVISCYGTDLLGHDVPQGYGCVRVPTTPGSHTREVACFTPEPSSMFQSVIGFLWGRRPEFVEPTIVASAEGRHVTRVNTNGRITINMDVILKDTKRYGFDVHSSTLSFPSEMKLPSYEIRGFHESTSPTDNKAIEPTNSGRQKPYPLERSNTRFIEEAIDQMQKEINETAGESNIPATPAGGQPATDVPTNSGPGIGMIQAPPRRAGKPRPLPALEDD